MRLVPVHKDGPHNPLLCIYGHRFRPCNYVSSGPSRWMCVNCWLLTEKKPREKTQV